MRINLCTPTRGKPDQLREFVSETLANAVLDQTRIVIGFDGDDDTSTEAYWIGLDKVIVSVAPREDALGAKYNRCAAAYDADLYVMGLDDVAISTKGWDAKLIAASNVFHDGIGLVYFGKEPHGESLPSMMAATKRLVDLMGYFVVPYFPFWWGNTWLDEIGHMIGRIVQADDIETRYPTEFDKPQRRDILFWAEFFDRTRHMREGIADRIIKEIRKPMLAAFEHRNACLRNPDFAGRIEANLSSETPSDPRHERLKRQALELLS